MKLGSTAFSDDMFGGQALPMCLVYTANSPQLTQAVR